jgi:hypothetical protein
MEKDKGATASEADPWWVLSWGLSMEGKCTNDNCVAGGKQVLSGIGYGNWDNAFELDIPCPMCKEQTKGPFEPWMYACNYRCKIKYHDSEEETKNKGDVKEGAFHHFDMVKHLKPKTCEVKVWKLDEDEPDKKEEKEKSHDKKEDHKKEKKEDKADTTCACLIY